MYADDTNVFFAHNSLTVLQSTVNTYLDQLSNWMHINKLQLNVNKSKYIIFAPINKPRNCKTTLKFRGAELEQVRTLKFLGVWFKEDLSWNTHVTNLTADLSKITGCFFKIRDIVPMWLKKVLYYSLFYSRLSYCILVWGTTYTQNYKKLIILQKRVLRFFENYHGKPQHLSSEPLFLRYDLLKASQIYYYKLLQHIKANKLPIAYEPQAQAHYPLRKTLIRTTRSRTHYGKQHIGYQILALLNRPEFTDFNTLPKSSFKSLLIENKIAYR